MVLISYAAMDCFKYFLLVSFIVKKCLNFTLIEADREIITFVHLTSRFWELLQKQSYNIICVNVQQCPTIYYT